MKIAKNDSEAKVSVRSSTVRTQLSVCACTCAVCSVAVCIHYAMALYGPSVATATVCLVWSDFFET